MVRQCVGRFGVKRLVPLQQIDASRIISTREQQHFTLLQLILTNIKHSQCTGHRMSVGEWKSSHPISKAEAVIKFSGAIKIRGMNREMVTPPEANVGL